MLDKFFDWLISNNAATIIVGSTVGLLLVTVTVMYIVAFIQGRSISFWPPQIGEKPTKTMTKLQKNGHDVGSKLSNTKEIQASSAIGTTRSFIKVTTRTQEVIVFEPLTFPPEILGAGLLRYTPFPKQRRSAKRK